MKIYELRDEEGKLYGFEIENIMLSRSGVCKVVRNIRGASMIVNDQNLEADEFCSFELNGTRFVAWEPFGDNSRFWIGPKSPDTDTLQSINIVINAFSNYKLPAWAKTVRIISLIMCFIGITLMISSYLLISTSKIVLLKYGIYLFFIGGMALGFIIALSKRGLFIRDEFKKQ